MLEWLHLLWNQLFENQEPLKLILTVLTAVAAALSGAFINRFATRSWLERPNDLKEIIVEMRASGERVSAHTVQELQIKIQELEAQLLRPPPGKTAKRKKRRPR